MARKRNMNRGQFLKLMGGAAAAAAGTAMLPRSLRAGIRDVSFRAPAVQPTAIHVFLYGGASELAGNLTNWNDIRAASVNAYPSGRVSATANGFWNQAGGGIMETMLAAGDMSVYRTINRRKNDTKAHGRSIAQNLVGNLNPEAPGIAATLAEVLSTRGGLDPERAVFPFVTLEGDSRVFQPGDLLMNPALRPAGLGANFANPYKANRNSYLDQASDDALESLAGEIASNMTRMKSAPNAFMRVRDFFTRRKGLANFVEDLKTKTLPTGVSYPAGNPMADRLRTAMTIAIHNPDTRFISIGNGGIGGWDAHSGALDTYTNNMTRVMEALQAAVNHMKVAGQDHRIIINVMGDFGRNVNLNGSAGWDHGNNQNLYTFGGKAFRSLGRVTGTTKIIGDAARNRLYTSPADGSIEYEPFAVASTIYSMFGVRNPEVLTGEPAIT